MDWYAKESSDNAQAKGYEAVREDNDCEKSPCFV